jgi:hypothetical protein
MIIETRHDREALGGSVAAARRDEVVQLTTMIGFGLSIADASAAARARRRARPACN